jgi:hypothetical protein
MAGFVFSARDFSTGIKTVLAANLTFLLQWAESRSFLALPYEQVRNRLRSRRLMLVTKETKQMNTRNIFAKLSIVIALAAMAATATFWQMRSVRAVSENQRVARFSAVGVTRGQSLRLNVANITPPEVPPDPYRVRLAFMDPDGNVLRDPRSGEPVGKTMTLQNGQSTSLTLNGDDFVIGDAIATGIQVRPLLLSQELDNSKTNPPDPIAPVLEVVDNATAKTSFLYPGSEVGIVIINSRH